MTEFCKLNMERLHHWFFQFIEQWGGNTVRFVQDYPIYFQKINNHELDTNKNMLCFDEIQLSLLKRLPNIEQKGCGV